jgi:hypothetical protein
MLSEEHKFLFLFVFALVVDLQTHTKRQRLVSLREAK